MADKTSKDRKTPPEDAGVRFREDAETECAGRDAAPADRTDAEHSGRDDDRKPLTSIERDSANTTARGIRRYRKFWGLTQVQLADLLGVTRTSVSQWELGATSISRRHMDKLARLLMVTPMHIRQNLQPTSKIELLYKRARGDLLEAHRQAESSAGQQKPAQAGPAEDSRPRKLGALTAEEQTIIHIYRDLPAPFRDAFWDSVRSLSNLAQFYEPVEPFAFQEDDAQAGGARKKDVQEGEAEHSGAGDDGAPANKEQ